MLNKEALKQFGRHLAAKMPVQPTAPLPSDLVRLVQELRAREEALAPIPSRPAA